MQWDHVHQQQCGRHERACRHSLHCQPHCAFHATGRWKCVATLRIHSSCVLITHTVHTLTLHDTSLTTQHTHHSTHASHAPQSPCHDHEFKSTGGSHCADELTLQAKVRDAARGRALPRNIYHSLPCVTRTLHARTNMLHTSRPLNETTLHACARTHTLAR
jgi:hypothetical protein